MDENSKPRAQGTHVNYGQLAIGTAVVVGTAMVVGGILKAVGNAIEARRDKKLEAAATGAAAPAAVKA